MYLSTLFIMNLYTVVILSKLTVTSNKNIGKIVLKRIVFNNLYSKLNININCEIEILYFNFDMKTSLKI